MAISSRSKRFVSPSLLVSRLQTLIFNLHRLNHTLAGGGEKRGLGREGENAQFQREFSSDSMTKTSCFDKSTWKVVDSRAFGIDYRKISSPSWTIMKILREKGFQAYLVGGCVRDLLLDRIPKDFDVITSAKLDEIKEHFRRAWIVGQTFPICQVFIKGSMVEVSSFDTVASHSIDKEKVAFSQGPTGCDEKGIVLWRNCLDRDFTINSLFYDPSANKIYDFANGMEDLKLCKVRTVIPAQLSFMEDCARILRGIRIAARLGLSFSEETAAAIHNLYFSVTELSKSRLLREMNFMFSYGAAASSLYLLKRFRILDILLPFHAAYLTQQAHSQTAQTPVLLFELFSSMDKLLGCDRPSENTLWVALLAFHLALVNNPQDALVIWAFASVMYHGNWKEAVKYAREKAQMHVQFSPEILKASCTKSDEALAEDVTRFASLVKSSTDALIEPESLVQSMDRYPGFPCSRLVFISKLMGRKAAKLFDNLRKDVNLCKEERKRYSINYRLLEKGDLHETRFVLGRVVMDTMIYGVIHEQRRGVIKEVVYKENRHPVHHGKQQLFKEKEHLPRFNVGRQEVVDVKSQNTRHQQVGQEKHVEEQEANENHKQVIKKENHNLPEANVKQQQVDVRQSTVKEKHPEQQELDGKHRKPQCGEVVKKGNSHQPKSNLNQQQVDENIRPQQQQVNDKRKLQHQMVENVKCHDHLPDSNQVHQQEVDNKHRKPPRQQVINENSDTPKSVIKEQVDVKKKRGGPLSSLFL